MKYISISDKLYEITKISFFYMKVEAAETDLTKNDVPKSEVFPVDDFREFRIRLINGDSDGMGEVSGDVIDFAEWLRTHSM